MKYTISAKQSKYKIVDFVKGFSILTIVLMHFIQNFMHNVPRPISLAASVGGSGVHVFIFCSGFGLYLSYLKRPTSYGAFLKSRFSKIYVPYILVVLVSACIPYMYRESDRLLAVLSHILLFKMFIPQYEESFGGQLWFISTIIQFYLLFIPLCRLKKKLGSRKHFFLLMLLISVAYWIFIVCIHKESVRVWNSFFLQYLWEFGLGMCLAEMLYEGKDLSIHNMLLWIVSVLSLAILATMGVVGGVAKMFNDIPALLGYGGLCVGIYFLNIQIVNKVILYIASISYELYLVHILVGKTITVFAGNAMTNLVVEVFLLLGMFIVSLLVADAFHRLLKYSRGK